MATAISAVLEHSVPEPGETAAAMADKLRFHTDSWDLSVDLKSGCADVVVIDARSGDAYRAGHIPGALSFPHREMNPTSTVRLDRSKVYVVYCDGIGCNASTKAAHKRLSREGIAGRSRLVASRRTRGRDLREARQLAPDSGGIADQATLSRLVMNTRL